MKLSINLLQESQKLRSRLQKMGLLMQTVSLVVMIVFGVIVFGLLSYTFLLSSRYEDLTEDIREVKDSIESMQSIESKHFLVKQKLTIIARTLDEHRLRYGLATNFYDFARSQTTISKVNISESGNKLQFTARASDVFLLISFLDRIVEFSKENDISKVVASGFSRNLDGEYEFGMDLEFSEEK